MNRSYSSNIAYFINLFFLHASSIAMRSLRLTFVPALLLTLPDQTSIISALSLAAAL